MKVHKKMPSFPPVSATYVIQLCLARWKLLMPLYDNHDGATKDRMGIDIAAVARLEQRAAILNLLLET